MIRSCNDTDFDTIHAIINDGAEAYRGVIPADRWHEPYMSQDELRHEIENGVRFWGYKDGGELLGVMGIQDVQDVTLIRHAYVRTTSRSRGIGGNLLAELRTLTARPVLIGTWAAATWAVRFYEKHGFRLVTPEEKNRLLKKYWSIPDRQVDTSVVLGDERWFNYRQPLVHHRDETPPIDCPFGHVQRIVTGGAGGVANVHVVKITKGTPHLHTGLRRGVLRAVRDRHDHAGPGDASAAARQRGRDPGRGAAFPGGRAGTRTGVRDLRDAADDHGR